MKRNFYLAFFLLLCTLLAGKDATAQVALSGFQTNPIVPNIYDDNISVNVTFSVLATRAKSNPTALAEVTIYSVATAARDNTGLGIYIPTTSDAITAVWSGSGNTESALIRGSFQVDYSQAGFGSYNKLQAVGATLSPNDQTFSNTSNLLILHRTPTAATNNDWPCYVPNVKNLVICDDQRVPYTTKPAVIKGTRQKDPNVTDEVWRWEYSYTNSGTDWANISGAENQQNFQPWDCWQTVYYRRVALHEKRNIWFQIYHEPYYESNTVMILPYVSVTSGDYLLRNRLSGQILEIGGGGNTPDMQGAGANQWPSTGSTNQQWNVSALGEGMYRISNKRSNMALEVLGSNTTQGGSVGQNKSNGGKNQAWVFIPVYNSPGFYTITNANSGMALEIAGGDPANKTPGTRAGQWPYLDWNTYNYQQQWELVPTSTTNSTGRFAGVYTLTNLQNNQVLEIGGSHPLPITAGTRANQWPYTGGANQHWTITETDNGYFKIVNRNSGYALEIGGDGNTPTTAGSFANQWGYWGGVNQQWAINEVSPGVYSLINRGSTYALEIGGGNTGNGAAANQWYYWGGANQLWTISRFALNRMAAPEPVAIAAEAETERALSVFPNPTTGTATIAYSLSVATNVTADVSDALGRRVVAIATDEHQEAGPHKLLVPTLAKGIYLVRLLHNGVAEYRKLAVE
jgi:hypothetical protein